jgi:hypothetical protein
MTVPQLSSARMQKNWAVGRCSHLPPPPSPWVPPPPPSPWVLAPSSRGMPGAPGARKRWSNSSLASWIVRMWAGQLLTSYSMCCCSRAQVQFPPPIAVEKTKCSIFVFSALCRSTRRRGVCLFPPATAGQISPSAIQPSVALWHSLAPIGFNDHRRVPTRRRGVIGVHVPRCARRLFPAAWQACTASPW